MSTYLPVDFPILLSGAGVVVGVITEVDVSEPEDPTTISSMAIASSAFPPQKAKNMNYDIIGK